MRYYLTVLLLWLTVCQTIAQKVSRTYQGQSLSEVLKDLNNSTSRYEVSFIYDELEDFTVTKTIKRGISLPDAVREVCGFYPVRVNVKGRDILVECIQKDRTKLMGRLVGPDRQPVAYANIVLYNPADSVIMGGGVSNVAGDFVIPCSAAQARVRISCVGFKTIEREMPISNVGIIRMQMENNYLGNVIVSGRMPIFRNEANRLQYIVSNDEFARGLNAQELLNRVPMVSMVGGRAMILGKGPAQFMLNGRVTDISNEAILRKLWTMRSEDIECIEVISNPSGREMMEMGGSYINIVMRRDQTLGWRGDISAEAGISDDWSERGSGSVTYASEKFDMTVDVHGGRSTQTTDEVIDYHTLYEKEAVSNSRTKQTDKEVTANLTLRYMPIKQLEFGGMLSCQTLWPENATNGVLSYGYSFPSEAELLPHDNTKTKSLTAYCDWQLDTKGKQLSLTYNYYKKNEDAQTKVFYETALLPVIMNWYYSDNNYRIQSGRVDLSLPFYFVTIETGASYTNIKNQGYLNYASFKDFSSYNLSFQYYDSQYDYQEKIKAAYLSLHREWDKFSVKAGLRYEYRDDEGKTITANTPENAIPVPIGINRRNYWLPSFGFSFKPQDGHQINLSWGTNSVRPNFYDLNPLPIYKTGFETTRGDPGLLPSRTSHIELSYHNHQGLYVSSYYHHASNVVDWRTTVYGLDKQFNVNSYPTNMGRLNKTGLYLHYQRQLNHNLCATAEGEAYYQDYYVMFQVPIYTNNEEKIYGEKNDGWGERMSLSIDWYLNRQHTLLLNTRYLHCFSDYQGSKKIDGYGYFYLALRYSMLNDRLKLSLVANDPFHQYVTDKTQYDLFDNIFTHTNHHAHYLGLTATYSFGDKKVRRIQHDIKDTERQRAEKQNK